VAEEADGALVVERGEAAGVPLRHEREHVRLLLRRDALVLERAREADVLGGRRAAVGRLVVVRRDGRVDFGERAVGQLVEQLLRRPNGRQLPLELARHRASWAL
jgi:hypothetical protein